jgi:plasmid maintenance system antidote protein VapI
VAKLLDGILSKNFSKEHTTPHFDGDPSMQKSMERTRRSTSIKKSLGSLSEEIEEIVSNGQKVTSRIYKKMKHVYRPSPSVWRQIMKGLQQYGWNIASNFGIAQGDANKLRKVIDTGIQEMIHVGTEATRQPSWPSLHTLLA